MILSSKSFRRAVASFVESPVGRKSKNSFVESHPSLKMFKFIEVASLNSEEILNSHLLNKLSSTCTSTAASQKPSATAKQSRHKADEQFAETSVEFDKSFL
jgi:hypothetical protein